MCFLCSRRYEWGNYTSVFAKKRESKTKTNEEREREEEGWRDNKLRSLLVNDSDSPLGHPLGLSVLLIYRWAVTQRECVEKDGHRRLCVFVSPRSGSKPEYVHLCPCLPKHLLFCKLVVVSKSVRLCVSCLCYAKCFWLIIFPPLHHISPNIYVGKAFEFHL